MSVLKSFTLTWWQGAMFKWGVFLVGICVGSYWQALFKEHLQILLVSAILLLTYVTYVWWKQVNGSG